MLKILYNISRDVYLVIFVLSDFVNFRIYIYIYKFINKDTYIDSKVSCSIFNLELNMLLGSKLKNLNFIKYYHSEYNLKSTMINIELLNEFEKIVDKDYR